MADPFLDLLNSVGNKLPATSGVMYKGKYVPNDLVAFMSKIFSDKRDLLSPAGGVLSQPIDLTAARSMELVDIKGDFLYSDIESTGKIYVKLNNTQMPWIPLRAGQGIKTVYDRIYVKNTAQAGCSANLLFGYGSEVLASPQMYQWYDRNPIPTGISYAAANVAPHAATQRAIYTVPNGKKAMLELVAASVYRQTAAAPAGEVDVYGVVTPLVGTNAYVPYKASQVAVGAGMDGSESPQAVLIAGEAVKLFTADASTGGTCLFVLSAKVTEYDS